MTPQFHEGQEVEVLAYLDTTEPEWQRAKFICRAYIRNQDIPSGYKVEFSNGLYEVFPKEYIRAVSP